MDALGIILALSVAGAIGAWYAVANRRLSERVLGHDPYAPGPIEEFLTTGIGEGARVLRAMRSPSADSDIERERVLSVRRFKVFVAFMPVFPVLAPLPALAAAALARVATHGIVGTAIVLTVIGVLIYRSIAVARIEYDYGNGQPLRRRDLGTALGGAIACVLVLGAVGLIT